jgi:hypothetical protein
MKWAKLLSAGALLLPLATHAGEQSARIGIDDVNVVWAPDLSGKAWGSLGYARNSADSVQAIGCDLSGAAGGMPVVHCFAVNVAGKREDCWAGDWTLAEIALAINSDSNIGFSWDPGNKCTSISTSTDSTRQPK